MPSLPLHADTAELFNIAGMLAGIEASGGISRALLAKKLGLSRTTASTIVSRLLAAGLVAERSSDEGPRLEARADGRGRPGILLDLGTQRWFALGAEYHSGRWAFAITNLKGGIVASATRPVPEDSPEAFLSTLLEGLREAMLLCPGELLPAIGIGAPGLVDCGSGRIIRADDLGWISVPVGETVSAALGLETYVINRNRGSGLAEARFGVGKGVHSLVYIGIGTGISAAFVSDGSLLHGSSYSAGEIGHVVMDAEGPVCRCGKRGCLQVLSSGLAMARRASALIASGRASSLEPVPPAQLRGEEVCAAAADGDPVATQSLREAASSLGLAVANIITTFNPDKVILGGPVGQVEGPFLDLVKAETARWAMDYPYQAVRIERGRLGEFTGALGAACLVLDRKLALALGAR
ncbi:MAG TPA: ROK family transcriptional regulator [Rectinemataceae bacterium]|nr:ROK family transcriptional regulator [Rectinemataceae bacterium]